MNKTYKKKSLNVKKKIITTKQTNQYGHKSQQSKGTNTHIKFASNIKTAVHQQNTMHENMTTV